MRQEENKAAVEKMLHDFLNYERWEKVLDENNADSSILCPRSESVYGEDEYYLPTAPNPFEQKEIIRL